MTTDPINKPRTDAFNLGKTVLQIEREQLKAITDVKDSCMVNFAREQDKLRPGAEVNQELLRASLATLREEGTLSADECAIAVNDPNGCASWLRSLADDIEAGQHVGTTKVTLLIRMGDKRLLCQHPVRTVFPK